MRIWKEEAGYSRIPEQVCKEVLDFCFNNVAHGKHSDMTKDGILVTMLGEVLV